MSSILKVVAIAVATSLAAGSAMAATAHHKPLMHKHVVHKHISHKHVAHKHIAHKHVHPVAHKPAAHKPNAKQSASEHRAVGKIAQVDTKKNTLKVGRHIYRWDATSSAASYKAGQKVQITYKRGHGQRVIAKISPVQA